MGRLKTCPTRLGAALLLFATAVFIDPRSTAAATAERPNSYVTENGIKMILIRAGSFVMGNERPTDPAALRQSPVFTHGGVDERPVHPVRITYDFYIADMEITAIQYMKFQEDHGDMSHFSPYATGMSWEDAEAFCRWLGKREGRSFRLPTESEWEYVARAGSGDHFSSGALPPASGVANAWGVKNMHTDAMEWVRDWYDDYREGEQVDPVGAASGIARVVRGGGLNMPYHDFPEKYPNDGRAPFYRRSANRAAVAPQFRGRHNIGFRIVEAPLPATVAHAPVPKPATQFVRQANPWADVGPDADQPWFRQRDVLPIPPENATADEIFAAGLHPSLHGKNHDPGLAVAPNGDLIAVYFSASVPEYEDLTDVNVIATRLRFGSDQWELPGPFFDFAGTKDVAPLITREGNRLYFACGGSGLDGVIFRWQTSDDNGATWSPVRLPIVAGRRGDYFPQPISNFLRGADGMLYLPTDGSGDNSLLWASRDEGITWSDTGSRTRGRHTVFVNRRDGSILGLGGKGGDLDGYMPKSISHDGGRTWTVSKTPFPAVGPGGQKPAMIRLASGRLFIAADWTNMHGEQPAGINREGAFVSLSEDEGESWVMKDLAGVRPSDRWELRDRPGYRPSPLKGGTLGYAIAAQGVNGVIHVLTSSNYPAQHFELNEAWILDPVAGSRFVTPPPGSGDVRHARENHPDGRPKAAWSVRADSSGRMLLDGTETHWHPSGAKHYEATWRNGRKTGVETNWDESGRPVWQWDHRADGTSVWTHFRSDGSKRRESTWRGLRCDGPARAWNRSRKLISETQFKDGVIMR